MPVLALENPASGARGKLSGEIERAKVEDGADAIVLVTEWPQFLALDWAAVAVAMSGNVVIDGRNALDGRAVAAAGLDYEGIGIG